MSAEPVHISPARSGALDTSSLSSQPSTLPLWDRLSTWASENKAIVYTIAGVAVVISGAGVVYYLTDARKGPREDVTEDKKKQSKKERRKAKKERERGQPEARETPQQSGKLGSRYSWFLLTTCSRIKQQDS